MTSRRRMTNKVLEAVKVIQKEHPGFMVVLHKIPPDVESAMKLIEDFYPKYKILLIEKENELPKI